MTWFVGASDSVKSLEPIVHRETDMFVGFATLRVAKERFSDMQLAGQSDARVFWPSKPRSLDASRDWFSTNVAVGKNAIER